MKIDGQELVGAPAGTLERVRGKRIAMIFQDPSSCLNPVHRIGWQLGEALRLHRGLDGAAAQAEALRLLDQVGIADARRRLSDYPHQLSGGLNQRVMIAMALAGQPDLLVADEPTTALDATIQAQILALLAGIRRDTGMALVLISHDLGVVAENVDRVAVMYAGRLVEEALGADLFGAARHPYTQGLLAALPTLTGPRRRLAAIPGTVPDPWNVPAGCRFAPRCPVAEATLRPAAAAQPANRAAAPRGLPSPDRGGLLGLGAAAGCRMSAAGARCSKATDLRRDYQVRTGRGPVRRQGRAARGRRRVASASRPAAPWGWWASRAAASRPPASWCSA